MNVILPQRVHTQIGMDSADCDQPAVLYLLHGLSDDHTIWVRRTSIERYVAGRPLAVVMPAVNRSFYTDMAGGAYWTFISEELPGIVQSFFNVSTVRDRTFVAGLSMGGYGAFKLALAHPDRFAAAASLSGCLDICACVREQIAAEPAEYETIFGPLNQLSGSDNDLLARVVRLETAERSALPRLYQCCGTADTLIEGNRAFRDLALKNGLPLTSEEHRDESHEWGYWDRQIRRVLDWMTGWMD